jgi:hypothetical protein
MSTEVLEGVTVTMPESINFHVKKKLSDELDNMKNYINEEMKKTVDIRESLLKNHDDNYKLIANDSMLMINYSILIVENDKICTDIDQLGKTLFSEKNYNSDKKIIKKKSEFYNKEYYEVFFLSLDKMLAKKLIKKIKELKINHKNITKILSK